MARNEDSGSVSTIRSFGYQTTCNTENTTELGTSTDGVAEAVAQGTDTSTKEIKDFTEASLLVVVVFCIEPSTTEVQDLVQV